MRRGVSVLTACRPTILIIAFLLLCACAQAQSLYWERVDVDIQVLSDGVLDVTEEQEYVFDGEWNGGYRDVPLARVDHYSDISVSEEGRAYERGSIRRAHNFIVFRNGANLRIKWRSHEPGAPPYSDEHIIFTIRYRVHGAINDASGWHELYWKTVFPERDSDIKNASVRITLPQALPDRADIDATLYPITEDAEMLVHANNTITIAATNLPPGEALEAKILFPECGLPHTVSSKRVFNERIMLPLFGGIAFLAFIVMLLHLMAAGRDAPADDYATWVTSPPSDISPAVAGTLIDEKAGTKEVIAMILDLAARRYIDIHQNVLGKGLLKHGEATIRLLRSSDGLSDIEKFAIAGLKLCQPGDAVRLSELEDQFSSVSTKLQEMFYNEVTRLGYFRQSPEATRNAYLGYAFLMAFSAVALFLDPALLPTAGRIFAHVLAAGVVVGLACLLRSDLRNVFLWVGIVSFGLFAIAASPGALFAVTGYGWVAALAAVLLVIINIFGHFMPARTSLGSREFLRWRAFRDYLKNLKTYDGLNSAERIIEQYLPYAVAFGIERDFVAQFDAMPTIHGPSWYHIGADDVVGSGFSRADVSAGAFGSAGASGYAGQAGAADASSPATLPSLNSMTSSLFSTLNSMSSSLSSSSGGDSSSGGGGGGGGGGGW